MNIRTKLDALQAAENTYYGLLAKPNALAADIETAKNDLDIAHDIYSLDLGMDN